MNETNVHKDVEGLQKSVEKKSEFFTIGQIFTNQRWYVKIVGKKSGSLDPPPRQDN